MEVEKTPVRNTYDYLENIAAAFFDENGKPVEEKDSGEYGRSYVVNFSLPKKEKSKRFVPESSFSPIYVPEREIRKH